MTDYEHIRTERSDGVGIVSFDRPEALNALNAVVEKEVTDALMSFDADDSIGCIVLAGGDKAFCAGADLKFVVDQTFESAYLDDLGAYMDQVAEIRKPIIAAVRGFAFGGGTEIALMCDIILADTTAQFALPEVGLGVIPGAGGPARLTRAVGKAKAMYYVLTGKRFDAAEAERIGLITKVVEDGHLMDEAMALAREIAAMPRLAVLACKEGVNQQAELPLVPGRRVERRLFHGLMSSGDKMEGMTAFAEKRKPSFRSF